MVPAALGGLSARGLSADPAWIAYAPRLNSPGTFAAIAHHFGPIASTLIAAVVPSAERFRRAFPDYAGPVLEVGGHVDGCRTLYRLRRAHPEAKVYALQNPVLAPGRLDVSLLQNHLYFSSVRALAAQPIENWHRSVLGTIGTTVQVLLSASVIVLNPQYPQYWNRLTRVEVAPNELLPGWITSSPQTSRDRVAAYVGSFHGFRGLHVALDAFLRSGLASSGWHLVVHASEGTGRYTRRCRALAEASSAIRFSAPGDSAQQTLASASVALFPSRIEGSSIAFLEALELCPTIVALDRPHFRLAADRHPSVDLHWVSRWRPEAWAAALTRVAEGATR